MLVNIFDQQSTLKISPDQVRQLVCKVIEIKEEDWDELNIHFVDTKTISELHEQFFDDPSPTDCISFPIDCRDAPNLINRILGEIFICPETAIQYAAEHQTNALEETTLYIVHGLLHLLGFDDLQATERRKMRLEEARLMQILKQYHLVLTE